MMWTIAEILKATEGRLVRGSADGVVAGIAIDSRRLLPGEAFIAIQGRRFDGHDFVQEALRRGASCIMVAETFVPEGCSDCRVVVIAVSDTLIALGDMARFHRLRMGLPVIAVTGSCGKTTTKDLTAHLLGALGDVLKNEGNQNNHIGVPLTLLRLHAQHRVAVIEMGTNHPGEIAYLASIVQPDMAIITNIGPAHLEFFGSLMGILREKLSLLEALPTDGCAVIPGDQLEVGLEASRRLSAHVRIASFGTSDRCDLQAMDIQRAGEGMRLRLRDSMSPWYIPLLGQHNVENALAAITCVWAFGLPLSVARERLTSFAPVPLRSEVIHCGGLTILNDCYNANPLSCARALEALRDLSVHRRLAVIGDMLELGSYAPFAHQAIGRLAVQVGVEMVMAVGEYAHYVAQGVREAGSIGVSTYRNVQELLDELPMRLQPGDGVLVKGSRRLNLERVTEFILQQSWDMHEQPAR